MMTAQDYSKKYSDSSAGAAQDRVILHCDMNGFFASVELLERPELRDVPMAVCGDPDSRHGIILAKNEPAKKYGIVTAETLCQTQMSGTRSGAAAYEKIPPLRRRNQQNLLPLHGSGAAVQYR